MALKIHRMVLFMIVLVLLTALNSMLVSAAAIKTANIAQDPPCFIVCVIDPCDCK